MSNVCLIEDSDEVGIVVKRALKNHDVAIFRSLSEARSEIFKRHFDLVILDIELPDGDGLRFCAEIKAHESLKRLPVFLLTGKTSIQEKTLGFQLGIDDFISKPFDPAELKLRVDAKLRKITDDRNVANEIVVGNLLLDLASQRALIARNNVNETINLSSKEFGILVYLSKHAEQVKSREQILSAVWQTNLHVTERTVDSHISRLRKKLAGAGVIIEAVSNSGYRLSMSIASIKQKGVA